MQFVMNLIGGILNAVFRFLKSFGWQLWMAIRFAFADYDSTLQKTKTPVQRFFIWIAIGIMLTILIVFFLTLVAKLFTAVTRLDVTP